jgi:uncharacterized protein YndB with AHSA1/START domain
MTTNRDFKRLVRGRMQKTGESYTAARARLLARKPLAKTPTAATPDYAKIAGMSDATMKAKTGCTWDRWVWALDRVSAHEWPHRDIAEHVSTKYKVSGWWSQMVTVGYERIKGLRAIGQRRGGAFEASKSKVVAAPVARLYGAWRNARTRARWLPGVAVTIRTATRERSMRITWPDKSTVAVWFTGKGARKSQVALAHGPLPTREVALQMKEYWGERLVALEGVLKR